MLRLRPARAVLLCVAILPLAGCLFHSRKVERQVSTAPLRSATQQELVDAINVQAAKIHTLQATLDIDTSVGDMNKGQITDYKEIRGYVLAEKPALLRLIGLMPIVRNRAFDMVSDGKEFKLWLPAKNRFVFGREDEPTQNPALPLASLRPKMFYDALLIRKIDPENEIAVLEDSYETVLDSRRHRVEQPDYEIVVVRREKKGWFLSRKVVFSRVDLQPHRQLIYDEQGNLVTDVHYGDYKDFGGVSFPTQTEIERPREGYDITLNIVKLELNKTLAPDQFELQQPAGAEVVHLGQPATSAQMPNGSDPK